MLNDLIFLCGGFTILGALGLNKLDRLVFVCFLRYRAGYFYVSGEVVNRASH